MKNKFQFDVFISHSSKDKAVVRAIAERLRKDGLKVWFDEWVIKPGDNIPAQIEEGLELSHVLVLCMSANAFGSDWAQLESQMFRFRDPLNKDRRFVTLRLDDAAIKGSLAQFLYIDWPADPQKQEYSKLVEACRLPTGSPQHEEARSSISAPDPKGSARLGQASLNKEAKSKTRYRSASAWRKIAPVAIIYLVSILFGVGLLCLMLKNAERLVALGLVGNFYYIVLILVGLGSAMILFGVFGWSYARFTGNVLNGKLQLSGPIVCFALVVIGGFYLPKPTSEAFSVTVMVHGGSGPHDLLLHNSGVVLLTLGADIRQENIGDKGQAEFKNIPSNFRGQEVPLSIKADGFEMSDAKKKYILSSDSLAVSVRRKIVSLSGSVMDTQGRPVTNATVRAGEAQVAVDLSGHFTFTLQPNNSSTEIKAEVIAPGFEPWHGRFVPNAGDATVLLRRTP